MRIVNLEANPTYMDTAGAVNEWGKDVLSKKCGGTVGFDIEQHEVGSLSHTIHKPFQMVLRI